MFKPDEREKYFDDMFKKFKSLGKEGIYSDHYALSKHFPEYTTDVWKNFLMDQQVAEYINSEFEAIKNAELRKTIATINDSANSVGRAQIINSLVKAIQDGKSMNDNGPKFIYIYIPPTKEQKQAENIVKLDHDPFALR
jgi:uncharacterized membrane-anchored protein YjiN (DUF445 family)